MSDSGVDDEYVDQQQSSEQHDSDEEAGPSYEPGGLAEGARPLSPDSQERERLLREEEREQNLERQRQLIRRRLHLFQHVHEAGVNGEVFLAANMVPEERHAHFLTARRLLELLPVDPMVLGLYATHLVDGVGEPTPQTLTSHLTNGYCESEAAEWWTHEQVVASAGVMLTGSLVTPGPEAEHALHRVMARARPAQARMLASLASVAARQAGEAVEDDVAAAHVLRELAETAASGPAPAILLAAILVHHAISIVVPEFTTDHVLSEPLSDEELYLLADLTRISVEMEAETRRVVDDLVTFGLSLSMLGWQLPGFGFGRQGRLSPPARSPSEPSLDFDAELPDWAADLIFVAHCTSPLPPPPVPPPQPPTPPPPPPPPMPNVSTSTSDLSQASGSAKDESRARAAGTESVESSASPSLNGSQGSSPQSSGSGAISLSCTRVVIQNASDDEDSTEYWLSVMTEHMPFSTGQDVKRND
ncbi:uncharacterized protein LOC126380105 [Pectinophora gossypiella]|uniref:uncharacterized protein LOC126380105 n=1 Tax=Pectinophora gossypiella TaxID=13191 RepID=UPI00214F5BB2|nr:uncharacterized protein LOC126380105 [Pectinophora gossypiella]XP_049885294.1 uncharacterized protein LOC126380105 [Pectinophora gossypiella]